MPENKVVGAAYDRKAAFDLAAAFLRSGLSVEVFSDREYHAESKTQAAVYDMESFLLQPEEEYSLLTGLFRATSERTNCFMKSDSALRGNIGSELCALKDSRGLEKIMFIPAFPKARKFTRNGIQYQLEGQIDNCITLANASQLINGFRKTKVSSGPIEKAQDAIGTVYIVDCTSPADFDNIVKVLQSVTCKALAGTSALAEKLITIYHWKPENVSAADDAALQVDGKAGMLSLSTLEWKEAE